MKKIRKILGLAMIGAAVLVLGIPVLADSYSGYIPIAVTEYGGTSRAHGVPVLVDLNIQGLVDLGYLDSTGRDTRMREADYGRPYTLETSRVGLVVYTLTEYQSATLNLYTDYDPVADFDLVVGPTGYVTIAYHADLEFGDAFEIDLKGFIDTSAGADKNLVLKDTAFRIYISAEDAITASIYNVNWTTTFVTAPGIVSGIHRVRVVGDGIDMYLYVDEDEIGDIAVVAVPDVPGTDWILMQNSSLLSLEFLKVSP